MPGTVVESCDHVLVPPQGGLPHLIYHRFPGDVKIFPRESHAVSSLLGFIGIIDRNAHGIDAGQILPGDNLHTTTRHANVSHPMGKREDLCESMYLTLERFQQREPYARAKSFTR